MIIPLTSLHIKLIHLSTRRVGAIKGSPFLYQTRPPRSQSLRLRYLSQFISPRSSSWPRVSAASLIKHGIFAQHFSFLFPYTNSKNEGCCSAAAVACHHGKRKVCGLKVKVAHKWVVPPSAPLKLAKWTLETLQQPPQTRQNTGKYVRGMCASRSLSKQQPTARSTWKFGYLEEL